jgi:hypothetical protein
MPIIKLPNSTVKKITNRIEEIFDLVKGKLLNRPGKSLTISYERTRSLPGLYEQTLRESGGLPDSETLENLINSATNYIDALKLRSINQVVKKLEGVLSSGDIITTETISEALNEVWDGVSSHLNTIVDTELQAAKTVGILDGITRANASIGIDDPVVVFIPSKDITTVCEECIKIHLMPDRITPRAWYMSEVSGGYHIRGEDRPSIYELHPNGRCHMTTILPGWGFKSGVLDYIGSGYNIIADQRGNL